jgi:hypothetical protein
MTAHRPPLWGLLLLVATVGLVGCEPYMSLTDRIPAQTRQATALLPEAPRYAGMVDLETALGQLDGWTDANLREKMRSADSTRLGTFLDATGMDPETDLKAVYGAGGSDASFSAVLFADLTPSQMDRYLERVPNGGRATTYRDVPVYHLVAGMGHVDEAASADTLTMGFVGTGLIAVAPDVEAVEAMVDRHQDQTGGFRGNESYMTLVERVGHGSTAWLVGRDVLQTALRDSAERAGDAGPAPNEAGLQQMLGAWADRTLGLDEAPSLEGTREDGRFARLQRQVREQALSLTLTDEALEGEAYLTMRDEDSAANVVDVSKGVMAALRLSGGGDGENDGLRGLLDDVSVDRDGPIVKATFSVDRARIRRSMEGAEEARTAHRSEPSIRRSNRTTRRWGSITHGSSGLKVVSARVRGCNLCADGAVFSSPGARGG